MKSIITLFILGLLTFLCGCEDKNRCISLYTATIDFRYVDNNGDLLRFNSDETISLLPYYDLETKKDALDGKNYLEKCPIEILSITDENGDPLKYEYIISFWRGCLFQFSIPGYSGYKGDYTYIIKYKIPLLFGEKVEEFRLARRATDKGFNGSGWYNCKYNGENISLFTIEDLHPDFYDPHRVFDFEKDCRRMEEMLYNGNLVALESFSSILLVLPIDFTKWQE